MGNLCLVLTVLTVPTPFLNIITNMQLIKSSVLACTLLSLVHAAPVADPEPFIPLTLPAVTGAITLTVPALTIPGIGLTVTSQTLATALAAKGIVLAGFAKGAALGSLANTLNNATSDGTTYAQRFYNRNRRDVVA